jgi:nicotinic acid mononucleotide adenylyltransferase
VLGAYLSPSHQTYIDAKCGTDALTAAHRIALCEKAVSANEWLMVDTWEALHNDRPVNFTDVIEHLSAYLSHHIKTHHSIQLVYVFGSDNASFALAFLQRGYCVCVPRGGHELQHAEISRHPLIRFSKRILMLASAKTVSARSSSQIRLGDETALPEIVRVEYKQIRTGCDNKSLKLYLRDEKNWTLAPWEQYCKADELSAATRLFMSRLITIFSTSFQKAGQRVEIEILDLSKQRSEVAEAHHNEKIISLDSCIEGTVNLGVSRCFHLASPDNPAKFVARPGYKSLTEQFAAITPDEYILLDDDIATGATIEFVKKSLPEKCVIKKTVSLCNLQTASTNNAIIELCDFRDFLVGARNAGLVVKLYDDNIARAPYILPYVRPYTRVRLPVTQEMEFSFLIWQLNRDFFRNLSTTLQVQHADQAFQTLATYIGFGKSATMEAVCQWHMDKLL